MTPQVSLIIATIRRQWPTTLWHTSTCDHVTEQHYVIRQRVNASPTNTMSCVNVLMRHRASTLMFMEWTSHKVVVITTAGQHQQWGHVNSLTNLWVMSSSDVGRLSLSRRMQTARNSRATADADFGIWCIGGSWVAILKIAATPSYSCHGGLPVNISITVQPRLLHKKSYMNE